MPSEPLERPWTEAEIDAIRQRLIETMKTEGLSHGRVAREAGVKVGTFSPWISGNYAGRNDRIAEAVEKWFDARELRRTTQSRSPIAPTFVLTPAAKAFIALMEHAQHMPDFSVITGAPGEPEPEFVDRLTDRLATDAEGALAGLTEALRAEMEAATDMQDLARRLAAMQLDPTALAEAMGRGLALAHLVGEAAMLESLATPRQP